MFICASHNKIDQWRKSRFRFARSLHTAYRSAQCDMLQKPFSKNVITYYVLFHAICFDICIDIHQTDKSSQHPVMPNVMYEMKYYKTKHVCIVRLGVLHSNKNTWSRLYNKNNVNCEYACVNFFAWASAFPLTLLNVVPCINSRKLQWVQFKLVRFVTRIFSTCCSIQAQWKQGLMIIFF